MTHAMRRVHPCCLDLGLSGSYRDLDPGVISDPGEKKFSTLDHIVQPVWLKAPPDERDSSWRDDGVRRCPGALCSHSPGPRGLIDDPWGDRLASGTERNALVELVLSSLEPATRARTIATSTSQALLDAAVRANPTNGSVILRTHYCEDTLKAGRHTRGEPVCHHRRRNG